MTMILNGRPRIGAPNGRKRGLDSEAGPHAIPRGPMIVQPIAGKNPTEEYKGTSTGYANAVAYLYHGKPWFTYWDVPLMMRDSWLRFLATVWCSPFSQIKFNVSATSPAVEGYVARQFKRFKTKSAPSLLRSYFWWGYAPGGVEWECRGRDKRNCGRWHVRRVRRIFPHDAHPLVWNRNRKFAGFTTSTTGRVLPPYAFWFAGHEEEGSYYDTPPVAGAYDDWKEYSVRGGARHNQLLYHHKCAIRPSIIQYPNGFTTISQEDGATPIKRNNQLLALKAVEDLESGGNIALPSEYDENGNPRWKLEFASPNPDAPGVREYPEWLKANMAAGVGIPIEVVKAAETGSGWSGRKVPFKAWLSGADVLAGMLYDTFDQQAVRQGVYEAFGPKADYEVELESLAEAAGDDEPGGNGGPQPAPAPGGGSAPSGMIPYQGPRGGKGYTNPSTGKHYFMGELLARGETAAAKSERRAKMARQLAAAAMFDLQTRAHEEGDPGKYQDEYDAIADLAANPAELWAAIRAIQAGGTVQMGWTAATSRTGRLMAVGTQEHSGRKLYGKRAESALGAHERRQRREASIGRAADLTTRVMYGEATPDDLAELADHLPALPVENLRYARTKMYASFGGGRRKADMVAALVKHVLAMHAGGPNPAMQPEPNTAGMPNMSNMSNESTQVQPVAADPAAVGSAEQLPNSLSNTDSPNTSAAAGRPRGPAPLPEDTPDDVAAFHARYTRAVQSKDHLTAHDMVQEAIRGEHGDEVKDRVGKGLDHNLAKKGDLAGRYDSVTKALAGQLEAYATPKSIHGAPVMRTPEQHLSNLIQHFNGTEGKQAAKAGKYDLVSAYVRSRGGIAPDDPTLAGSYKNMQEAIEDGIPMNVFSATTKGNRHRSGLDALAQEMADNHLIVVPESRHPADYLLELMKKKAKLTIANAEAEEQAAEEAFLREQMEEKYGTNDPRELTDALRKAEADARREVTQDVLDELAPQHGSGAPNAEGSAGETEYDPADDWDRTDDVSGHVQRDEQTRDFFDFLHSEDEPTPHVPSDLDDKPFPDPSPEHLDTGEDIFEPDPRPASGKLPEAHEVHPSEYVNAKEYDEAYRANYFDADGKKIASSRMIPAKPDGLPVGTWKVDQVKGTRGRELEQLRELDPHTLEVSEDNVDRNIEGRGDDADRYASWMKEGSVPPPATVVETPKGKLKVVNGHRRLAAAKKAGMPLRAWVSPMVEHEGQRVPLTDEIADAKRKAATPKAPADPAGLPEPASVPAGTERTAKDGSVWVKAPAGGQVSPVNGQHYKGGQWMPIHGRSAPSDGGQATDGGGGPIGGDGEGGQGSATTRNAGPDRPTDQLRL